MVDGKSNVLIEVHDIHDPQLIVGLLDLKISQNGLKISTESEKEQKKFKVLFRMSARQYDAN